MFTHPSLSSYMFTHETRCSGGGGRGISLAWVLFKIQFNKVGWGTTSHSHSQEYLLDLLRLLDIRECSGTEYLGFGV